MGEKRRVLVGVWGREWDEPEVVACSEEPVERHQKWNHDLSRGPTYADLRATGLVDVDEYWAENFDDDDTPTDTELIDQRQGLLADGDVDWLPTEQTVNEFGDLLRDLGVPDPGWGMFYTPVEFVIPPSRLPGGVCSPPGTIGIRGHSR